MNEEDSQDAPHSPENQPHENAAESAGPAIEESGELFSSRAPAGSAPAGGEDDGVEIIFYAEVGGEEDVFSPWISAPSDLQDEVRLLLPSWSGTTVAPPVVPPSPPPPRLLESKRSRPKWLGCLFGAIAAFVVLSMLGSSLAAVFWFWNVRNVRSTEVEAALATQAAHNSLGSVRKGPSMNGDQQVQPAALPLAEGPFEAVNRIAFVNEDRQVETISADGSERRALTDGAVSYQFPAWSPDGQTVAAIGSTLGGGGIYVVPDENEPGEPQALIFSEDSPPFYLYWAPDGRKISFLANATHGGLSLNVVDITGEEEDSRTIALGSPLYWNWTSDSQAMLVHAGSGTDSSQLGLYDDFGRPLLPPVPNPGPFQAPGISANGFWWAYSQYRAGGNSWLVADNRLGGENSQQRYAGLLAFNWSPVRNEVAFISGGSENRFTFWGPLRLMDAETGEVRLLSRDTVLAFFWSPDGKKIATISLPPRNEGFGEQFEVRDDKERRVARTRPAARTPLAAQAVPHIFQVNVIDVASGEGLQLIEAGLSPLFLAQFMPYFDQYAFSHSIWSPDSNAIVMPIMSERRSEVSIIDTRNGHVTPLADGSIGFWSRQ